MNDDHFLSIDWMFLEVVWLFVSVVKVDEMVKLSFVLFPLNNENWLFVATNIILVNVISKFTKLQDEIFSMLLEVKIAMKFFFVSLMNWVLKGFQSSRFFTSTDQEKKEKRKEKKRKENGDSSFVRANIIYLVSLLLLLLLLTEATNRRICR